MHRLLLATFITAFALRADTFTFTSCTSGTTTISPCGGSYSSPAGLPDAMAGASASDNSLVPGALPDGQPPIPDGWTMSTGATAVAQGSDNLVVSATANASASDTFHSAGPVRSGFIQFNVTLLQLHGGNSTAVLTDGIHRYSYDALGGGSTPPFGHCFEGCQWASTVPFNLGVEFQVNTSSNDTQAAISFPGFVSHGNTSAVVTFRLLEADETTVVPFSVVLQVQILIKPGSAPPVPINAGSHGKIPVAILSTSTFDAVANVDPNSLTFGNDGNEQSLASCNTAGEDVNGDGLPDLVCHFETQLAAFQPGDTVGILKGKTVQGSNNGAGSNRDCVAVSRIHRRLDMRFVLRLTLTLKTAPDASLNQ